jgi:hypothetical protein
MMNEDEKIL